MSSTACTGALEAIAPTAMDGYLRRNQADSDPGYEPPHVITLLSSVSYSSLTNEMILARSARACSDERNWRLAVLESDVG
jgi:hypothetical protein